MKMIDVYVLRKREYDDTGDWRSENVKVTTVLQEAWTWVDIGPDHFFELFSVEIPQEIQVQRDY